MANSRSTKQFSFQKNPLLEELLGELAETLKVAENSLSVDEGVNLKPNIFIVGSPRSGTTLLYQALASTGAFCYPTNFLSRFYSTLGVGCKIQKMLFDKRFQFRDELKLIDDEYQMEFSSELGKTKGPMAPNVFWYFWYHHFNFGDLTYLTDEQWRSSQTDSLVRELRIMQAELSLPIVMKGMIMNWNLLQFSSLIPNAIFLRLKRDPLDVVNSIYEARSTHSGDSEKWWSFKPPEFEQLIKLPAREQVAGFYLSIENALDQAFQKIPNQILTVEYADFCRNPNALFSLLESKFDEFDCDIKLSHLNAFQPSSGSGIENSARWNKAFDLVQKEVEFFQY
jgi:hypothetical protein